ncbi:MAG: hypothetical protein V1913_03800, partial [Fibrobacterota bacterium]
MKRIFSLVTALTFSALAAVTVNVTPHHLSNGVLLFPASAEKVLTPMKGDILQGTPCLVTPKGPGERKGTEQKSENGGKAVFVFGVKQEDDYTLIAQVR